MTNTESQDPLDSPDPTLVDALPDPAIKVNQPGGINLVGEWLGIIIAAFLVSILIKSYVVQTFYIPSASMENTLLINDHLLVNKLAYKYGDVKRGDIVVFKTPPAEPDKSINDLIKRVIALPGDTVQQENGVIYVNGNKVTEPYVTTHSFGQDFPTRTIPKGDLWVMGDNRGDSSDSRVFGPITEKSIVGKAEFRVWPISRFGSL